MAEKGADLVICQHSHCIGAFENFNGSVIVYGQGNFLFDRNDNEFWETGILVKASFTNKMKIEFIPVRKKGNGVELPDSIIGDNIIASFHERSKQITESRVCGVSNMKNSAGKRLSTIWLFLQVLGK